ncbi:glucosaminidase domain-containing protein [Cohnella lupini]|uniref:SH3 domain-containing protein n=1 Tax=Cohnella lupini TaxID=1294267 RepID=A0A3D9IYW5_9BACL|nr:glucosaminidase domain-containing protein [Cohnella lupini]RED66266.1 SH3 domain-containing protein [Cohnella lupini]
MRRKFIRNLFICAFGAALLLALGLRFQASNNEEAASSIVSANVSVQPSISTIVTKSYAKLSPETENSESNDDQIIESMDETAVLEELAKNAKNEVHISALPAQTVNTYQVTAHYLNVRANGYPKSKVIKVIEKGTLLEIVRTTDNGWLRIKGGGYVHGDYAARVSGGIAMETSLSAKPKQGEISDVVDTVAKIKQAEDLLNPVKPSSTVGVDSGLSEEDIAVIFEGTDLEGHGLEEAILQVEEEYGINALFTIAVMKLESGNGSSKLAKSKNNLFGLNASGGDAHKRAFSFETKGDSVRKFGQLLSKSYVGKGYTTIEKIATKYCPANSKWSGLVKNIMKRDYKKLDLI